MQDISQAWQLVQQDCQLTDEQLNLCKQYLAMLLEHNAQDNLTAIIEPYKAIMDHIYDSLLPSTIVPFGQSRGIVDIGSGGGLPGIPLAIKYPDMQVVLVEVIRKKVNFLREVTVQLELDNVEISDLDWRTFTKKTNHEVDYCVARASLQMDELLRMYGGASNYRDAQLVYWASATYDTSSLIGYNFTEQGYTVANKKRRLIIVAGPQPKQGTV